MDRKSFRPAVSAMSSSTKSKPASASSPATGGETNADKADAAKASKTDKSESKGKGGKNESSGRRDVVEVELEHSRQREIAWAICGTIGGILLVFKLGTVGVWGGFALIAYG